MLNNNYKFDSFTVNDVENRVKTINTYNVLLGIFIEVPATIENTEVWAQNISTDQSRRDFVLRDNDKIAGFSGLVNINVKHGYAELYIFISEDYKGRGVGSYLMECTLKYAQVELNLRKITLYVSEGNDNAIRFYDKFGFVHEGTLVKHSWHRGSYVNRYIYSLFLNNLKTELDVYKAML